MSRKVAVILPAAGCGQRLQGDQPKQFIELLGRPILFYAIDCFIRHPRISNILVILPRKESGVKSDSPSESDPEERLLEPYSAEERARICFTRGAETRHRSIKNSVAKLKELDFHPDDLIIVQDAVRIFCPPAFVDDLVQTYEIKRENVIGTYRPLVSTVLSKDTNETATEDGGVRTDGSLFRSNYVNSEMPQAFRMSIFSDMYEKATKLELDTGTECLALAMAHGGQSCCIIKPILLLGDESCWKITYPRDIERARLELNRKSFRQPIIVLESSGSSDRNRKCWASILSPKFSVEAVLSADDQDNMETCISSLIAQFKPFQIVLISPSSSSFSIDALLSQLISTNQRRLYGMVLALLNDGSSFTSLNGQDIVEKLNSNGHFVVQFSFHTHKDLNNSLAGMLEHIVTHRDLNCSGSMKIQL